MLIDTKDLQVLYCDQCEQKIELKGIEQHWLSNSHFGNSTAIGRDLQIEPLEHEREQMIPTVETHVPS